MFEQIRSHWGEFSFLKRAVLVVSLAVLLLALVFSTYWVMRVNYQVLFSDLNPQDASSMVAELDRLKVPYQLADNGSTILVEQDAVYKTRLKLMGKGLNLNGSVGFEIFNSAEFGMTEFAQKVNYQRALQGELARTIMGFEEVKSARVHLVLPESGLFKHQNAKPKASVSVQLKDGSDLTHEQVTGIQRLVAASVPEINPSEVTVVDQRGVAVTKLAASQDNDAAMHEQLDMKKQLEDYMTRKVVSIVDRAVGPGKAIVSIDVSLNYDQIKVTKEDVIPLPDTSGQDVGAVVRRKESMQGDSIWGDATSNISGQNKNTNVGSSSTETEFVNSRRVEQVLSSPGNIFRLSVGVLVPDTADQIKLAKLKEMIAMAVGINSTRGDGLVVYGVDMPQVTNSVLTDHQTIDLPTQSLTIKKDIKESNLLSSILSTENLTKLIGIFLVLAMSIVYLDFSKKQARNNVRRDQKEKVLTEITQWINDAKSI